MSYGGLWYLDPGLFENTIFTTSEGTVKTLHQHTVDELRKEFNRSQEIFIKDHRRRYQNQDADAWKILEVASFGTLSKLYVSIFKKGGINNLLDWLTLLLLQIIM
jgi:hypothetical protein